MDKTIFITGCILGVLSVVLGAFAAHGLERSLDADAISTFQTGVTYQMYHALFLMLLGSVKQLPGQAKRTVFILILLGVILFSFSIYLLATNGLTRFDFTKIAVITPIGGLLMIAGWVLLGYRSFRHFG